jgi:hypothetical protein
MWAWKIARGFISTSPMIALLALVPTASAQGPIATLPETVPPGAANYHMSFVLTDGKTDRLAQEHKSKCEKLGPVRCRVLEFNPGRADYSSASIKFILASGSASTFMSDISRSTPNGFTSSGEMQSATRRQADLELDRQLKQAQRDRLISLENSSPAERVPPILLKRSSIETALADIDTELSALKESRNIDALSIDYTARDQGQSRLKQQFNELGEMFILGSLIVTGTALLTALYLGILAFAFLWLRKFAIKRGLFKVR